MISSRLCTYKIRAALIIVFTILCGQNSYAEWDQHLATIEAGSKTYYRFCSICHGFNAKGDGSFKEHLVVQPPDLTTLSLHNNGEFPWLKLYKVIDGNSENLAHGSSEMPVWGNQFNLKNWASGQSQFADVIVRGRIFEILVYLQSIQETK